MFKHTLRQHLEKLFPDRELARWFDPLNMDVDEGKNVLRVSFPHTFFGRWFMDSVKMDFEKEVLSLLKDIRIEYNRSDVSGRFLASAPHSVLYRFKPQPASGSSGRTDAAAALPPGLPLLPEYSFDNFLVNRKNDFPLAAAREALNGQAQSSFFFVFHGQSGTGKSHLLSAMANVLKQQQRSFYFGSVELLASPALSTDFSSIPLQAVFLDDAHRVSSSVEMQDALASLIDTCYSSRRLLILSLDMHPSHCAGIHPKLRSRLNSGLVSELKRPDLDIRTQYVQKKNRLLDLNLSKETILSVAQRYPDIRGIDGFLAHIRLYRSMVAKQSRESGAPLPPMPDPASMLDQDAAYSFLSPTHIINTASRHFSLSPEDIVGKSRDKSTTLARQMTILLCRELLGLSLVQVGRIFGGRDHSSILYSIKKIKQMQESNKEVHNQVEVLRKLCLSRT